MKQSSSGILEQGKYKAQEDYQKRNGLISKTYKLKKEIVDNFGEACKKNGQSQASVLTSAMERYIEGKTNSKTHEHRKGDVCEY